MSDINVLLVDDHAIVRAGFLHLLESEGDFFVYEALSGEEAYRIYQECTIDIIVMDINMPGMGGLAAIKRLRARYEDVLILVLSMNDDPVFIKRSKLAGARGYLTKHSAPEELANAIKIILEGKTFFKSKDNAVPYNKPAPAIEQLSQREFDVFRMLAEGKSVAELANVLNISPKTAGNHRSSIMSKLALNNTAQLTRIAIRNGIIDA